MKRILRYLTLTALLISGALTSYFLAAVVLTLMPVNGGFTEPDAGVDVFLISNGTHVDLALPVENAVFDWREFVPLDHFHTEKQANFRYISFGWGEKAFYFETPTWGDLTVSTALKATLVPSESAMHVTYLENEPRVRASCKKVRIDAASYEALCGFVREGFDKDEQGAARLIELDGYGKNDRFYEGAGDYHALSTCNDWTNRGLKTAGVRTAMWAPFERSVLYHLD